MVYGFGRIDASGRVADKAVIRALGWRGGDVGFIDAERHVELGIFSEYYARKPLH